MPCTEPFPPTASPSAIITAALFLFCLLACFAAASCQSNQHNENNNAAPPPTPPNRSTENAPTIRIVAFGDSITKGVREGVRENETFCALLEQQLLAQGFQVKIIRAGVSGETAPQALLRLQNDVLTHHPQIVALMYGTNDAFADVYNDPSDTSPRVPLPVYEQSLRDLVRRLKKQNILPLLMTSVPMGDIPDITNRGIYGENDSNILLRNYIRTVRRIADEENIPIADHFKRWLSFQKEGGNINELMTDGVHPNPAGHRMIMTAMLQTLLPILNGQKQNPTNPAAPFSNTQ